MMYGNMGMKKGGKVSAKKSDSTKVSADMVSPRKAMAMGMKPSGAKKTAKKGAK
jgi:hypothetical protein